MIENKENEFDLDKHILSLLRSEPFFAALSRRINKSKSRLIPTAGVRVNPKTAQFEMLYNPDFFEKLTKPQRLDVLKHEFYHLVFLHVTSRKPEDVKPLMWNYATDLSINSHLDNLPENCLKPGGLHFEDFPSGLTAEQYLKLLKKKKEEDEKDNKGKGEKGEEGDGEGNSSGFPEDGQFDSHDEWSEDGELSPSQQQAVDIAKERLKDFVKEAAEEAQKSNSGWGTVPADVRREIISRLQTNVDWRKVLRYFIKTSLRSSRRSTVKRLNKRYRYIHPGKKVSRMAKIAISIDQSGSVCDEMLELFFAELNKLAKLATFTIVPFDTRVEPELVYEWKKGTTHDTKRVMCGGTDFDAPTEYVNKKSFDGHIVLTDMAAPKPKASKCQRMWMTTKACLSYQYFQTNERVIVVDK
jgi:predicted metal-dependent peptidase